jgi:protein-tyrosine phosphatase
VTSDRQLHWQGCFNTRDLGTLPTADGRRTRWGAVVRSDQPQTLTEAGWSALDAHGIRTIVDLRNSDQRGPDSAPRPTGLTTVHVSLEDAADTAFWDCWGGASGLWCTPLYYSAFLERFPERCAAAVAAVAQARPGGVLIHCRVGRDRTGLVALLLLALAGVAPEAIAADYEMSGQCLPGFFAQRGEADEGPIIERLLRRENTTARAAILRTLEGFDVDSYLRSGGLTEDDCAAVRARLLAPIGADADGDDVLA